MKITKKDINGIAREIKKWATKHRMYDYSLFYNGKRFGFYHSEDWTKRKRKTISGINPLDYCEWFPEKFLLGLTCDGAMWECFNGYRYAKAYEELESILDKHGLYLELCDSCHATVACNFEDDSEVEYTIFKKEKPIYIRTLDECPEEICPTMAVWHRLCVKHGDEGACVIGEYMEFRYKGELYRMIPPSPYQGSMSWETSVPHIKELLAEVGATEIYFNYGILD